MFVSLFERLLFFFLTFIFYHSLFICLLHMFVYNEREHNDIKGGGQDGAQILVCYQLSLH